LKNFDWNVIKINKEVKKIKKNIETLIKKIQEIDEKKKHLILIFTKKFQNFQKKLSF